jgi:adenylate cyclase
MCLGEFDAARDAMLQAEAIYDPARFDKNTQSFGQDPCVACLAFGSIALHLTGDADGSARAGQRSMELAGQLGQPSSMALALHFSAMLHQLRGDAPGAERQARRAMELAAWEEFSFWHAGGRILCAWAAAVQGRNAAESIAELRAGIDAWLATGSRTYHTYFLGLLADALLRHGRTAEALEVLEGAIDLVSVLHEGLHHAELHRLTAACLARSRREGVAESALEELETAAAIARGQGAHWVVRQVERQREELTRPAAMARGRR